MFLHRRCCFSNKPPKSQNIWATFDVKFFKNSPIWLHCSYCTIWIIMCLRCVYIGDKHTIMWAKTSTFLSLEVRKHFTKEPQKTHETNRADRYSKSSLYSIDPCRELCLALEALEVSAILAVQLGQRTVLCRIQSWIRQRRALESLASSGRLVRDSGAGPEIRIPDLEPG